jgi:serine/threonine-protein kinase RsbW
MLIEKNVLLHNNLTELDTLASVIETFSEQADIDLKTQFQLNLALDELFTNIVKYGYNDNDVHQIEITLKYTKPIVSIKLVDDGKAFDPTQKNKPELTSEIEERNIGGLGIHFVATVMDKMEYCRLDNYNQLLLEKTLSGVIKD